MKKIGLIGGMSFESTITYYEQINRKINERLGGLSSAEILLSSVNFEEIEACQRENRWDDAGEILVARCARSDTWLHRDRHDVRLFDTTQIHIVEAALPMLEQNGR